MKSLILIFLLTISIVGSVMAAVPMTMNYQGSVKDSQGNLLTGTGYFKFSFVDELGTVAYWSNDGATTNGSEPTSSISLAVENGLFSVRLGDVALTNMEPLDSAIFNNTPLHLRVWFSEDNTTFEQFSPDTTVASSAFAIKAGVAEGLLGSDIVNSGHIVDGTITDADISATALISASKINTAGLDAETLNNKRDSDFSSSTHDHNLDYSGTTHNHDLNYSGSGHNHNTDYSGSAHNHDLDYPGKVHTHSIDSAQITDDSIKNIDISSTAAIAANKINRTNLNADLLDGLNSTSFSQSNHGHKPLDGFASVSAAAFDDEAGNYLESNSCQYIKSATHGFYSAGSNICWLRAGMQLPHLATATGLTCYVRDNDPGVGKYISWVALERVAHASGSRQNVFSNSTETVDSTSIIPISATSTTLGLINNNLYSYQLFLTFGRSASGATFNTRDLSLVSCKVSYVY